MAFADNTLGRSLSDVMAKTVRREPSKGYLEVDIGLLTPPKDNPRQDFDAAALQELSESIRLHGVLQPIVVLRRELGFEVLSGERRWRAAKMAGLAKVPVVVREDDNPQHLAELRLIENIQRENLNPMELASAYQKLIDDHQLTHEQIAERVHKERSSISNLLRLLQLPPVLQQWLSEGKLSLGHAKVLLGIADATYQAELARKVAEDGMSVRALENLARLGPARPGAAPVSKPAHLRELEANLKLLFGVPVSVVERGADRGAITLNFQSRDEFERVVAIMNRIVKQAKVVDPAKPAGT